MARRFLSVLLLFQWPPWRQWQLCWWHWLPVSSLPYACVRPSPLHAPFSCLCLQLSHWSVACHLFDILFVDPSSFLLLQPLCSAKSFRGGFARLITLLFDILGWELILEVGCISLQCTTLLESQVNIGELSQNLPLKVCFYFRGHPRPIILNVGRPDARNQHLAVGAWYRGSAENVEVRWQHRIARVCGPLNEKIARRRLQRMRTERQKIRNDWLLESMIAFAD